MVDTSVTNVTIGASLAGSFSTTFTRARSEVERFIRQVKGSTNALSAQTTAFDSVIRRAGSYASAMRGAGTAAAAAERNFRSAGTAARASSAATDGMARATRNATSAMNDSVRSTSLVVSGQRSLQNAYERTTDSASRARAMVASLSREMAAATSASRAMAERGAGGDGFDRMQRRLSGRSPTREEFEGYPDLSRMQRRIGGNSGGGGGYGSGGGSGSFGGGGNVPALGYGGGGGGGRFMNNPYFRGGSGNNGFDLAGVYIGGRALEYGFKHGASYDDETVKMRMSGMSEAEIKQAQKTAWDVSRSVRGSGVNENMKSIRELRFALGDTKDANNVLEGVQKSSSILGMLAPRLNTETNSFAMVKALEEKGVTNNKARTTSLMEGMTAASVATGGKVTGNDFLAFTRKAKAAAPALSDDFYTNVAPFLMQRLGSPQAGNAIAMSQRAMIGGHMDKNAKGMLGQLGLFDRNTQGAVGGKLFQSDPDKWVNQVMLPQLEKLGRVQRGADGDLTDDSKAELARIFTKMYSSSTVASAMTLFATQQKQIQKDRSLNAAVPRNAYDISQNSPLAAMTNLEKAFGNLTTAMTLSNMPMIAKMFNTVADGMNALSRVDKNTLGTIGAFAGVLLSMGPVVIGARLALSAFYAPLVGVSGLLVTTGAATSAFGLALTPLGAIVAGATASIVAMKTALYAMGKIETAIYGKEATDKSVEDTKGDLAKQRAIFNDEHSSTWAKAKAWWRGKNDRLYLQDEHGLADTELAPAKRVKGHAYGGSFTVKGATGTDSNLVQFAATAGERVTVDTEGSRPGGAGSSMNAKQFANEIGKGIGEYMKMSSLGSEYGSSGFGLGSSGTGSISGGGSAVTGGDGAGGGVARGGGRRGFMSRGGMGGVVTPGGPRVGPVTAHGKMRGLTAEQQANAQESYNFWRGKGATHEQALAALGNEQVESGFKPGARGDGGTAHGIFQWHGDRRRNIMAGTGINIDKATHLQQLEAGYWEMTKGNERDGGRRFFGAKSLVEAEDALVNHYERPADRAGNVRSRSQIGANFGKMFSPDGKVLSPGPVAGMPNLPPGTPSDVAKRLRALKASGAVNGNECVALAKASVGVGGSVHDWRRGESVEDGNMVAGTPVSTFLNRDGSQSNLYAGGGSGTRGAGLDHAAVFENYIMKDGRRVGMRVAEQYAASGGVREKNYMFGQGRGEHNGSNYAAVKTSAGDYLGGSNNPMTGSQALARAEDRRKAQQAATHEKEKGSGGHTVHAPITIQGGHPEETARAVQAHIEKHQNNNARGMRGGTFDWTA